MAELFDLVASSGTAGSLIAWVVLAGAGLWLWERYERTRTRMLIERQRRARIKRTSRRSTGSSWPQLGSLTPGTAASGPQSGTAEPATAFACCGPSSERGPSTAWVPVTLGVGISAQMSRARGGEIAGPITHIEAASGITRRSRVRIPPPLLERPRLCGPFCHFGAAQFDFRRTWARRMAAHAAAASLACPSIVRWLRSGP
jgi:hypothetical protein